MKNRYALFLAFTVVGVSFFYNSLLVGHVFDSHFLIAFGEFINTRPVWRSVGFEYFSVARSIVETGEFARPFPYTNELTAWVAPVPTYILAFLYWLVSKNNLIFAILVYLAQMITFSFVVSHVFFRCIGNDIQGRKRVGVFCLFSLAIFLISFRWVVHETHDTVFFGALLYFTFIKLEQLKAQKIDKKTAILWGGFGGVLALCGPVLGFAWACGTVFTFFRYNMKSIPIMALLSILVVSPWIGRNYLVFGHFVPIKSNGPFELYQSQFLLPDGIVSLASFGTHPINYNSVEGVEYRELGEKNFLKKKKEMAVSSFLANPSESILKVFKRLSAVTFNYSDEILKSQMNSLFLVNWMINLLIILSLLFTLFSERVKREHSLDLMWLLSFSFILPYVLVSYYERYGVILYPFKLSYLLLTYNYLFLKKPVSGLAEEKRREPVKMT